MIHEITFTKSTGGSRVYADWAWELPEIKAFGPERTIRFKPGLNVLFGRNGSGKTTIVRSLALTLAATLTGRSMQGETWLREVVDSGIRAERGKETASRIAAKVIHDGQPVVYGSTGVMPGMADGHVTEEFFEKGLSSMISARGRSAGERTYQSCADALAILHGKAKFPTQIHRGMNSRSVNDLWGRMIDFADENFLKGSGEPGQPTILLDEPDAHWAFTAQANLWRTLGDPRVAERFQLIVATHSPFAIQVPHAHVIAMPSAFLDETRKAISFLANREAAPSPVTAGLQKPSRQRTPRKVPAPG